jgi:hypothetical protein
MFIVVRSGFGRVEMRPGNPEIDPDILQRERPRIAVVAGRSTGLSPDNRPYLVIPEGIREHDRRRKHEMVRVREAGITQSARFA